jgi:polyphosphate kinase
MANLLYSHIAVDGVEIPYLHRDISWLDFNYRVLQEAKDIRVPLLERIKFLAIYSNNLDEFFRVRVANNRNLLRVGKKTKRHLEFDPKEIQKSIISIVNKQQREFSRIFSKQIINACKERNIYFVNPDNITIEQENFIDSYFNDYMLPFVQPVLLQENKIKPFFTNASLYLAIHLKDRSAKKPTSQYAVVKIPSDQLPRFIVLPSINKSKHVIFLDDIIRSRIQYFFPGYHIVESYSMKLSRDAELYIDDEFSGNLVAKIKNSLSKRNVGPASRLVYDRAMPKHMLDFFATILEVSSYDLFQEGRYHNNFDFFQFPTFNYAHLKNNKLKPIRFRALENAEDIFAAIKEKDHLIHVPYHSYESVLRFFEEAASDPKVTHIKVVQYRVAKESRIMEALISAAKKGKHVSVFVEVKARFDEQMNLNWGEKLEKHGIHVRYSFPGLKVHSKIALIQRREGRYVKHYCYMSTGNFHENTVKIYSDIGLFTADEKLTREVAQIFALLESTQLRNDKYEYLLVGQFNLRQSLKDLILFEIEEAKAGRRAEVMLKMNSLQDPDMIKLLYEASQAGVKIRLIIRGICSLVPGLKNWSDNIKAISIVDRYLEHTRLFLFYHGGDEKMYASSADWMVRNLSHRIETAFPILDQNIKSELQDFIEIQWSDNVKTRSIHAKKNNTYRTGKQVVSVQSQLEIYSYYKRREEK